MIFFCYATFSSNAHIYIKNYEKNGTFLYLPGIKTSTTERLYYLS